MDVDSLGMSGESGTETTPSLESAWTRYRQTGVWTAVLCFLAAWTAIHWYQTAVHTIRLYNPLPTWDYWRVVSDYPALKASHFGVLWRQHNEHRILFPEIVFELDMFVCHGRMLLPLIVSPLCYAGIWLTLTYCIWIEKTLTLMMRITSVLLAGGIIGWQGSAVVLARPFLLVWTLSQICALLALLSLWGLHQTGRIKSLIGCIAFAVRALYSSGNALVLWPILIAGALAIKIRRHHLYVLLLSAIASIGCYFVGYHGTGSLGLAAVLNHPLYALELLAVYMAMPFSAIKSPMFGVWVGFINVALAAAVAVIALRKKWITRLAVICLGSYLFTLLTAALIVVGKWSQRSILCRGESGALLDSAAGELGLLILLLIWTAAKCNWNVVTPKAIALSTLLLCLVGFPKLRWWLAGNNADFVREKTAAIAIENGVTDPIVLRAIFPDPNFVMAFLPMLHEEHLSVFHPARSKRDDIRTNLK